jgi:hypothetical protein
MAVLEACRLGKLQPKFDERTFFLVEFLNPDIPVPASYDFDARRARFEPRVYGNDEWNNCVIVARAHQLLRLERIEQFRTLPLTDEYVIEEYQRESNMQFGDGWTVKPGDRYDRGLVVLDALKRWRDPGWEIRFSSRSTHTKFKISAFGRIDPSDQRSVRRAIFLCTGIQIGFQLPQAVKGQTIWDVGEGKKYEFGSWGGQLAYAKRFDRESIYVISWGREIRVTNEFAARYADEAWAVVHDIESWKAAATLDLKGLRTRLE